MIIDLAYCLIPMFSLPSPRPKMIEQIVDGIRVGFCVRNTSVVYVKNEADGRFRSFREIDVAISDCQGTDSG
jgi:hypothetical protein